MTAGEQAANFILHCIEIGLWTLLIGLVLAPIIAIVRLGSKTGEKWVKWANKP